MLVVHPASLCDVCLDPYSISSEPANSPHAIACGHIFCLACLRNLSPSACPLCRKAFQPDRVKKLHVAGPPEIDGAEATQLLQRVAIVSAEDAPEDEIVEVITEVEEWLATYATDENSYRPLRTALDALKRYKALQERNERENAEFRRVRRELKAYRRNAHQDSKTSRAVEESLLSKINELESEHVLQLSRLHAEIDSLRGESQQPCRNTSNPLPPPPKPLPLDLFPAFARPGDTADPLLNGVPYPPPPPRVQPTTSTNVNGYPPAASYTGTSRAQYVPPAPIPKSIAVPRARHAEVPLGDERSRRPSTQEVNGVNYHPQEERRPYGEGRGTGTDGRPHIVNAPQPVRRIVPPSPTPSWASHPLVEERRSDDEREADASRSRTRTNGASGVVNGIVPLRTVEARLASAEAYLEGYGSGYESGFHIMNEPATSAPSSYGSDRSDRVHMFPVLESPDQPVGGLGLMGVPQPMTPGTVSTPDEDATPVNRARRLTRRNTTQAVDMERSGRNLADQSLPLLQNGGGRRVPVQTIDHVLRVRRTVTEGAPRRAVNGSEDLAGRRRSVSGIAVPLEGGNESPRSETTWGTVQTLSRGSLSGRSMSSLGMLTGLHNGGGVRGQGSVSGESYVGREDGGGESDGTASTREEGETETPTTTGSLPGSGSDVSSLGLIREDEAEHPGSRIDHVLENGTPRQRSTSYSGTTQDHRPRRARRSEETGEQRRHASHSRATEALHPEGRRAVNASDITSTNALSLHFDASFPTHDYARTFSAPSGPEIFAPTPIVGGPNIIHLWANHA